MHPPIVVHDARTDVDDDGVTAEQPFRRASGRRARLLLARSALLEDGALLRDELFLRLDVVT